MRSKTISIIEISLVAILILITILYYVLFHYIKSDEVNDIGVKIDIIANVIIIISVIIAIYEAKRYFDEKRLKSRDDFVKMTSEYISYQNAFLEHPELDEIYIQSALMKQGGNRKKYNRKFVIQSVQCSKLFQMMENVFVIHRLRDEKNKTQRVVVSGWLAYFRQHFKSEIVLCHWEHLKYIHRKDLREYVETHIINYDAKK